MTTFCIACYESYLSTLLTFSGDFHLLFIDSPESCSCFYYDNGFIITIGFFACKKQKKYDLPSILLRIEKPLHLNYVLKIVLFVIKKG
jgi:hypothetical protein